MDRGKCISADAVAATAATAAAVSCQGAHRDIDFVPDSRASSATPIPPHPNPPTSLATDARPRITQNTDTWVGAW